MAGTHRRTAPAPAPAPQPAAEPGAFEGRAALRAGRAGGRDPYVDALRALALVRVVTYHTFGWPWLGFVFPSMGVMFALAGSLMARSLERPAWSVIRGRLRRLLVPVWVFGLVLGSAMVVHGWVPGPDALYWVLPVGDPPGNAWGEQAWAVLWYLRTYLWFVLLSPVLLRLFSRWPLSVAALSLVPVVLLATVWQVPDGRLGSGISDLSVFLFCWLLGFAHRDGTLDRIRPGRTVAVAAGLMAAGAWWALTHRADGSYDLDDIPLAQALWSGGAVALLLRFRPGTPAAPGRVRFLGRVVRVFNSRAVTIYLWHEVALMLSVAVIDLMWQVPSMEEHLPLGSTWFQFAVAWPLIAAAVAVFGWVEDVAARRSPRLLP
ncbi:acyltransferase [Streptomyces sp. NBC_00102]|uniref:acyltransferase family protein n=1 Tax=Streptomyces sp. NBC_00102 TaxID=2975652 RepID=UPI00225B16B9|nr:acyltransferase [Streptomyces sp. NBC_00102]MCX5401268.1 acyltransferase [Streptomyces sp. NBC_00102]